MSSDSLENFANLDFEREKRCGFPEVIYGASKTPEQITKIAKKLLEAHGVFLSTRVSAESAQCVCQEIPNASYFEQSGILFADNRKDPIKGINLEELLACKNRKIGKVVVACAGTSDIPVAQEAAATARIMGSDVEFVCDIGVAGLHRALKQLPTLRSARVIICVAGMEGALASLIAGLVDVAVVAVPTSVGYGASFGGVAALLSMLNSCAPGVSVVNIDNGFGAAQVAHRINIAGSSNS